MSVLLEHERPLVVTAIEDELREFWEEQMLENPKPIHRALTLNVIAVARASGESVLRASVQRLLQRHLCQAYLVLLEDQPVDMSAELRTRVRDAQDHRQILLQQVSLRAHTEDHVRIPSLIRPLLVSDIPTLLFWSGDAPMDLTLYQRLGELVGRVAFDSSLFRSPHEDLPRVSAVNVPAVDLSWIRMRPWRRALAQAFEHTRWDRHVTTTVAIHHGPEPGARAAATLLHAWLQRRLGADVRCEQTSNGGEPPLEPISVEIRFAGDSIRVEHQHPHRRLRVVVTLGDHCMLPFEFATKSGPRGDLLTVAADVL